jgi:hypothetical protein
MPAATVPPDSTRHLFHHTPDGVLWGKNHLAARLQGRVDRSGHDSCPRPPELMTSAATRCAGSTGVVRV